MGIEQGKKYKYTILESCASSNTYEAIFSENISFDRLAKAIGKDHEQLANSGTFALFKSKDKDTGISLFSSGKIMIKNTDKNQVKKIVDRIVLQLKGIENE